MLIFSSILIFVFLFAWILLSSYGEAYRMKEVYFGQPSPDEKKLFQKLWHKYNNYSRIFPFLFSGLLGFNLASFYFNSSWFWYEIVFVFSGFLTFAGGSFWILYDGIINHFAGRPFWAQSTTTTARLDAIGPPSIKLAVLVLGALPMAFQISRQEEIYLFCQIANFAILIPLLIWIWYKAYR